MFVEATENSGRRAALSHSSRSTEFRTDINGLRAVAVVAVLLYHYAVPGFSGGFVGVDIFYVLSGYLMTGILHGRLSAGASAIGTFYLARCRRIVPALLGLCAAVLLLGWFWVAPSHYVELAGHAAASIGFFSNIVYWQQVNYFNPDATGFWFLHTWSLSVEWQFYLLYPLFLLLAARLAGGADRPRLRLYILLTLAASFAVAVVAAARAPQAAFYLLPPRAWELLAGATVWLYQDRIQTGVWVRRLLAGAGTALTLIPIVVLDDQNAWATLLVAAPVAGTVLVLLAQQSNPLLDSALSQKLGLWSYSIYLWHWPIAVLLREADATGPAGTSLGLALSLLAGYASFRLIETPARKGLTRRSASGQLVRQLGCAGAIAAFALAVIQADGLRQRAPMARARQYLQMESDRQQWAFPAYCSAFSHQGMPQVCTLGRADAAYRVLVLGDSHAQQWYPWFQSWAQQRGARIDFVSFEGCPVGYLTQPGLDCAGFWGRVAPLAAQRAPQQIMLFSNWQVPGIDGTADTSGDTALRARIAQQLTGLLPALRAPGAEVTVVGALPRIDRRLPDDITSRLFRGSAIDAQRTADCSRFRALARTSNDELQQLAAAAGARFLDPLPGFCDHDRMEIVSADGRLLFRDGNHVSTIGAMRYGGRVLGGGLTKS